MTSVNRHPPFTGDPLHFAQLMDHAWRAFRELLGELVRPAVVAAASGTTLRPSQVRLLSLMPATGMRVTDLAARVGMTKQALGEFVATLQEAGLVEVTVDQRDRRVRLVRPTAAGRRLQGQVESAIAELERRWRDEVGEQRWATFREVLGEIGQPAAGPS